MHKHKSLSGLRLLLAALFLFALEAQSIWAENVFVTSYKGTTASTDVTPAPLSVITGASLYGASTGSASTASPTPVVPNTGRRVVYGTSTAASWSVTPTNMTFGSYTFGSLQNLGVYRIYVTDGESGNASPDILVDMTATGGSLADTNGVGASTITLDVFRSTAPDDVWIPVGYITNTSYNPTLKFTYKSGSIASTGGRWYMDAVWFEYLADPCAGVAPEVGVSGPLAKDQTFVTVTGVSAGATNITVYANNAVIGSSNAPSGFAAGSHTVATSALVQGASINATQSKTNSLGGICTSTPKPGLQVGGGPNPQVRVFLGCWQNATNAGPIGANSSAPPGNVYPYLLKATYMSYGAAPTGGERLVPNTCWTTVTFQNGVDDAIDINSAAHVYNTNDNYCSLESLVFAIDATDNGPYDIYVDSIMNGTNVVEDFEGYAVDTEQTFVAPNATTLPAPSAYLTPPNSSLISSANAYDGTKSCRIQWQWADTNNTRWARVMANSSNGKHYPQLDTHLPITVSYLVLPVGSTTGSKFNGTVSAITNSTPVYQGGTAELGVSVTGSGSYTYAWSVYDSESSSWSPLGVDTRTCTINPVPNAASSRYMVSVSDGGCTKTAEVTLTTPVALPAITNQPASIVVQVGSPANTCVGATPTDPLGGAVQYYEWDKMADDGTGTNWNWVASSQTATCLSEGIPSAQLTDTGYYRAVVQGVNGQVISRTISVLVVPADVTIGDGTGLRGDYFNLTPWSSTIGAAFGNNRSWAGTPALTEVDSNVNFVWGSSSPGTGVNADYFGVRWYGQIQPLSSDTYTFDLYCGDGARLWIDKQLVINTWSNQYAVSHTASVALTAAKHDILLEYFESTQSATAQLYWDDTGSVVSKSFVPIQQLFANKASWTPAAVTLTAPANGSSVTLPAPVSLSATVVTNDAIVKSVQFYTNNVLLTTVTSAPFTYSWTPPAGGNYAVSASVLYNESAYADSSTTNTVTAIALPPAAPVTITNLIGTTLTYGGGSGSEFVLLQSATVNATMSTWTPIHTNTATPGTFTVPGPGYYRIQSK